VNRFSKEYLTTHYEKWEAVKHNIEKFYDVRDPEAVRLMEIAIDDYTKLLEYGGKEINERTGKSKYILLPLNGDERFNFIKDRINSHYAHIQLDALYEETKKKAARLAVMKK